MISLVNRLSSESKQIADESTSPEDSRKQANKSARKLKILTSMSPQKTAVKEQIKSKNLSQIKVQNQTTPLNLVEAESEIRARNDRVPSYLLPTASQRNSSNRKKKTELANVNSKRSVTESIDSSPSSQVSPTSSKLRKRNYLLLSL